MLEKRHSPRVPVSIKIETETEDEKLIFGYARDISTSGMSVSSQVVSTNDAIPNIGDMMNISFKLPKSDHKITVCAKLVRVDLNEGQMPVLGLSYLEIEKECKTTISKYVSQTQMSLFSKKTS